MLSPALSELLERARTRFGLEVEVMDATLRQIYPGAPTALARKIEASPEVRQSLLGALAGGRPEQLDDSGVRYQVFPLRRNVTVKQSSALVVVRNAAAVATVHEEKLWPELARAIVEADFAAAQALTDERQQSRRLLGTMRFVRDLVETDSETSLGLALAQAAAVWFDVDARVFERDLAGNFVLHTALPGARVEDSARRLSGLRVGASADPIRVGPVAEWGDSEGESEVVLIPLASSGPANWVLALIGAFPQHAEPLFALLGRVAGAQFETFRLKRRESTRRRFQSLVEQTGAVDELVAVRLVRELAEMTHAGTASLLLNADGGARRLVSLGSSSELSSSAWQPSGPCRFDATEFVCTVPLGDDASATFVLNPAAGQRFGADAELVTSAAIEVIQGWLIGAQRSLQEFSREQRQPLSEFVVRIDQELERAKRFDLRLSLVLVQMPALAPGCEEGTALMTEALRKELRGSDVLGIVSGRVAALLTHTDSSGSHNVVRRLRRRLSESADRLPLAGITVGQAAFSAECCTSDALLSRAAREAQPVAV